MTAHLRHGWRALVAGTRARRTLLRRRLTAELQHGLGRIAGFLAIGLGAALLVFGAAFAGGRFVVWQDVPEVLRSGTSAALLGLSGALVMSSLGHAAQAFFGARDLWFWDCTPVPPWARFLDRTVETAVAALPNALALGGIALVGLMLGGQLGALAALRALVAVALVALVPLALGIALAHVGGAFLPAGKLRRVSLVVLGVGVAALLVWFRRARVEKMLSPQGAAELLAGARNVGDIGPRALPSSVGSDFVLDGSLVSLAALLAWGLGALTVAYLVHRLLSRRARDLAVDESPVGLLRGSLRDRALKAALRPLPPVLRPMVEKDLLAFVRDPGQWGQLVLLLGVGVLYLVNADALRQGFDAWPAVGAWVLPSMHTGLVCFIAAGLGARFAFPQVGLEGPAVWIVDGAPLSPRTLMTAKWIAAVPVVAIYPALVAAVGGVVLRLDPFLWTLTTLACAIIAGGIAAFGVGRGARNPLFDATSLSDLAVAPGALSTMLAAVALAFLGSVGAMVAGGALVAARFFDLPVALAGLIGVAAVGVPAALTAATGRRALFDGALAFERRRDDLATRQTLLERGPLLVDQ
ncbi:MAG: hypothetical protein HYS27_21825 [Deltaproteobacteria bacterium]|nr:hypothetical protein [Deltaproteobacteria bacterium]